MANGRHDDQGAPGTQVPMSAGPRGRRFGAVDWPRPALLEGTSRGQMPWSRRTWTWILPITLFPMLVLGTWWGAHHIENDVEAAAQKMLEDVGVDTSGLTFTANYRDVTVRGVLPAGVDPAQIRIVLEDRTGSLEAEDIRSANILATEAAPPALGAIVLEATSDGASITFAGSVPSQSHKEEVLTAASTAGLTIVSADDITASGLEPSATDADGQIRKFSSIIGGLTVGSFVRAELTIGDEGPVAGTIEAADADSATLLIAVAGDAVEIIAPPVLGSLDTVVTFDGTRVVLNGTVLTDDQSNLLTNSAASVVGLENVVNNLIVSDLEQAVSGANSRVAALSSVISTFGGLNSADVRMNDTDITVNGEAIDEAGQTATTAAVAASGAVNLRPGGQIDVVEPPEPEFTLQEEIDLLQAELDSLRDEIRTNVVFNTDSDVLDDGAAATLDKVIDAMNRYPGPLIETGGHTDSQGADDYNLALSQSRADAVVAYIVAGGIDAARLRPVGFGETQPISDNNTPDGRVQNRRVEFIAKESF